VTAPNDVFAALVDDGDDLDRLVAGLDDARWALETPAVGWTIAHQVAHLTAVFGMAATAASDPAAFNAMAARLGPNFTANVTVAMAKYLSDPPPVMLARWRSGRADAAKALAEVPGGQLVPWLVRPIPAPVLAMAGMMELFGHGQDIADTVGVSREHTDRIRYLVEFAVRTWDFGYLARGLTPPDARFRFELTAPSGARWALGSPDATEVIAGPAVDLCLLVTRRRHRDDLSLRATGTEADRWLDIAQAYRGPAGPGRAPGQFKAS